MPRESALPNPDAFAPPVTDPTPETTPDASQAVDAPPAQDEVQAPAETADEATPADPEALSPADYDPDLQAQRDAIEFDVSLVTKVTTQVNAIAGPEDEVDPTVEHTVVEVEAPVAVTLTAVDRTENSPYASLFDEHGRIVLDETPVRVPASVAEQLAALPYVKVESV